MVLGLIGDQVPGVSWVVGSTPTSSAIVCVTGRAVKVPAFQAGFVGFDSQVALTLRKYEFEPHPGGAVL